MPERFDWHSPAPPMSRRAALAAFALGCFWHPEAIFATLQWYQIPFICLYHFFIIFINIYYVLLFYYYYFLSFFFICHYRPLGKFSFDFPPLFSFARCHPSHPSHSVSWGQTMKVKVRIKREGGRGFLRFSTIPACFEAHVLLCARFYFSVSRFPSF